jgi:hypothetical protein
MADQPAGPSSAAAAAESQGKAPPPAAPPKPGAQADAAPPPAGEGGGEPEDGAEGAPPDKLVQRQAQLTRQFAALSRREKELAQREKQWKAQQEQERATTQAEVQQARQVLEARRRAAEDPDAWLRAGGLDYDRVTDHYTRRGGKPGAAAPAPDDAWRKEFERKWEERERQQQEREQALSQQQSEYAKRQDIDTISRFVKDGANAESFELINHFGAYSDVYEYMDLYRQKYGEVPEIQAAAECIEEVLLEQEAKKAEKALAAKKLARRLGWTPQDKNQPGEGGTEAAAEAPPETPPKQHVTQPARGKQSKPSAPPASKRKPSTDDLPEDPDERWERIMRRAKRGGR